jgi:membrane protein insertase Oxa1/YidC/SpoIIIJ
VIYWAWNNTLSVLQQSVIMHKHGAKIELFDNLKDLLKRFFDNLKDLLKRFKDLFNKKKKDGE